MQEINPLYASSALLFFLLFFLLIVTVQRLYADSALHKPLTVITK